MVNKKVLLSVILIAVLAIGGYLVLKGQEKKSPEAPVVVDETAGWSTATDNANGFEFKVPPSFQASAPVEGSGFLASFYDSKGVINGDSQIGNSRIDDFIIPAKGTTSFPEYQQKYPITDANSGKPLQFKTKVIGSNTFYYARTERFEGVLSFVYYAFHGNSIFGFNSTTQGVDWTNPNLDEEKDPTRVVLEKILSTLRFTK